MRSLRDDIQAIVNHYELAMGECPKPCPEGPWLVLTRLFKALHEVLATETKPEPAAAEARIVELGKGGA